MCSAVAVTSTTTTPPLHLHTQNTFHKHKLTTVPSSLRKLSLTLQTAQYVDALPLLLLLLTCTRNYKSGLTQRVITYLNKTHCRFFTPFIFLILFSPLLPTSITRPSPHRPRNNWKRNSKLLSTRFSALDLSLLKNKMFCRHTN